MIDVEVRLYHFIAARLIDRLGDTPNKPVIDAGFSDNFGRWRVICGVCAQRERETLADHWQIYTLDLRYEMLVGDNQLLPVRWAVLAAKCQHCETIHFAKYRLREGR